MSRIVMYDQIGARKPVQSFVLDWKDGVPCTLRQIIAERVLLEHDRLHASRNDAAIETLLYAPNTGPLKKTNPDLAVAAAIEAFSRNAFMVVVGGKQMIALDDVAVISARTDVVFIKLLRLKGG
ncbi:MAG: hypothetical protein EOS54_10440 [Mesorhizobium sp.]|uniref:hypothetical protein n=1 Tax=unclassified Mesorhizobium TaxID=325217 RepID=UPI000F75E024|nr:MULTISPECIES: hypothetical protein [unclassified Mesorhizobium]AZO47470.1 hypothetical protein EJ073_06165 [Mesorhizobium sp. M4B.F.Ca.ET.058.02.1.1]RUX46746.1 hypothetical protein EOA33_20315 [Mesorhizobium sp. M4A.F.Ca.ET.050.02.1.1]RVC43611.1 hypothetical protein EN781_17450 [Mesorhizobium sp. M4A.F.Ca.ET.090.04.2.1]RWC54424.1 MAG: hypothetical protein EOS54_10440 [Mesorhizobium sp.]RWD13350.1 MAG: hypothetical protein EOS74_21485 [Mesorhizobium sp.]